MSATQTETIVNGDKPTSLTVNHITSYPLPADLLHLFESHPLGAKSISLLHNIYTTLTSNLSPYLQTPYKILAPYLERADHIGNNTLSSLDERFPAVKETDLNTVKSNAQALAAYPFAFAGKGREYVYGTYESEYKKIGGNENLIHTAKSIVSTELAIARDGLRYAKDVLGPRTQGAREKIGGNVEGGRKVLVENLAKVQKYAQQKGAKAQEVAVEKKDLAEQKGVDVANGHGL